jgi:hypothetical protein
VRAGPILDRLDGLGFVTRAGALEFAGLRDVPGRLPAAFVVPESEDAAPNPYATQIIDQKVSETFAVVLVLNANTRATKGAHAQISDEFTTLRDAVRQRLIGWVHPDATGPTQYVGGRLLSVDGTALTYALRFISTYHLRKAL